MLDLSGLEVTPEEKELLRHPATGGVILFSRNFESVEQVSELIRAIHKTREPSLLVAVDQEGGRVQRFKEGFTKLPAAALFGQYYDRHPEKALQTAENTGWLMASELLGAGIDFSFAPVLDINAGISEVIGDRSFHQDPVILSRLAHAWMKGARDAGMPSVGKHFPGHGHVTADSHHALPIDQRSYHEIESSDLIPFRNMIEYGLDGIMPAHVIYEQVDSELAGFSTFWMQEILRTRFAFQGVIFSDDLTMNAAHEAGSYTQRAQLALKAGCDMILACNNRQGAIEILDSLADYVDPVGQSRLARMHGHAKFSFEKLRQQPRWHQSVKAAGQLESNDSLDLDF